MRKPQIQPSLASLTLADREQLADWLRREDYDVVLERVVKPRPEGLDLDISKKPLQTFYAKVALLDVINSRLPDDKKISLELFESLASRHIHLLTSADRETLANAHDQILRTTADLAAAGDNTPHQLLALQRLADFPARAALRDQMAEIRAAKEQRAQAQADRAHAKALLNAEMHTHKTTLDLRKFEHKLEMDTFHQHIVTERLDLQKKSLALREKRAASHPSHPENPVKNPDGSSVRVADNSDRPKIRILVDEDGEAFTRFPTPNPLPDDIVIKNRAYTKKLLAGLVDPITGEELDAPSSNGETSSTSPTSISRDASNPTHAAPAVPHPESNPANPVHNPLPSSPLESQTSNPEYPSEFPLETRNPKLETSPETSLSFSHSGRSTQHSALSSIVNTYTIRRAEEYWTHRRTHSAPPGPRQSTPEYITAFRHCPCGQGSASAPCPVHESAEFGPFPDYFWKLSPHSTDYAAVLRERNLPYREPTELL